MTTRQLPLLTILPTRLRPRQQLVWDYLRTIPGGITADEAGAHLHAHKDYEPHSIDQRCLYCARDGLSVLRSKALKPLIIRRRESGKYEPRDPKQRATLPSSQLVELPDDLFGGEFGTSGPDNATEPNFRP